jgi:hypothetical protein
MDFKARYIVPESLYKADTDSNDKVCVYEGSA